MRSPICFLGLVLLLFCSPSSVGAQDVDASTDCTDSTFLSTALLECAGLQGLPALEPDVADSEGDMIASSLSPAASEAFVVPPYCRLEVDAVFWGGAQWFELAQALKGDLSQCAEYYVTVPPRGVRTRLMPCREFNAIRALSPRIHPVAEIRWTSASGWRQWVVGPTHPDPLGWQPGRTFYGAGVEARRRMDECDLDVTAGETWAFNELTEEVLENAPVVDGPHTGKTARVEVLEFMRGLYEGGPDRPDVRGIVFNVAPPSTLGDATAYKEHLKAWLEDEAFWRELDTYADFFAQEVYPSALNWGVADVPRATRAEYLNDYLQHMTVLAETGPDTVEAARHFLRRTYVPLGNAAWPHPNIGNTNLLSADQMRQFISTQVYAMRHYANAHPRTAPQGRIGFGWAPLVADSTLIRERLASAIRESSDEGTNSQMGACGPPGAYVWCTGDVSGALLNDTWKIFMSWD